jgi:hypothetical protein
MASPWRWPDVPAGAEALSGGDSHARQDEGSPLHAFPGVDRVFLRFYVKFMDPPNACTTS